MLAMTFIVIGCDSIVDQQTDADAGIATSEMAGAFSMVQSSEITCIDPGSDVYHVVTESKTVEWGGRINRFEKTVEIEYYNTLTEFVLRVMSSHAITDVMVDDESINDFDGTISAVDWQEFALDLEEGWKAGDTKAFQLQIAGFGPPVSFEVEYTLLGECAGCNAAGWILQLTGPTEAPFFAKGSMFGSAWTHESADPACEAPNDVSYAWTMNGEHLSSSSTAEIPARGYAGGIYSASGVETVVKLTATVGTLPAFTAERTLQPRPTKPITFTVNQVQTPSCPNEFCEVTIYPVFYNPDGDDEELVFEYDCFPSGGVAGETYCNSVFSGNTDYFPPGQTGPLALPSGRIGVSYTISSRVRKAYEDSAVPASWSRYGYSTYVVPDGTTFSGVVVRKGNPGIVIHEGDRSIGVGGTISYTMSASDWDEFGFNWSSDDVSSCDEPHSSLLCGEGSHIASVGTDGTVTGVAEGMVLITVRSERSNMYRYSVIVSVTND
jgi:hypothetical protein